MASFLPEQETKDQLSMVGEFIVLYEDINSMISTIIPMIILSKGWEITEYKGIQTLLEGMTADQLRNKFDALIADAFSELDDLVKINKKLSSFASNLPRIRNSIAHGSYKMGWKSTNYKGGIDKDTFMLKHGKATKNGFEERKKVIKTKTIERLIQQMSCIFHCYSYMNTAVTMLQIAGQDKKEIKETLSYYISNIEEILSTIGKIEMNYESISN